MSNVKYLSESETLKSRRQRSNISIQGQSLFEVVFALAIAAIIMTGIVSLAATTVRNSSFARNDALATRYVQEASEWLRQQRDEDWTTFRQNAETTDWCLKALSWDDGSACVAGEATDYIGSTIFQRNVTFACYQLTSPPSPTPPSIDPTAIACSDPNVVDIEASIIVMWSDAQGDHESRTLSRYTKWQTP